MERTTKIVGTQGLTLEVEPVEGVDGLYAAYSKRYEVAVEYDSTTDKLTGKGSRKHGEMAKKLIHRAIKSWEKAEGK